MPTGLIRRSGGRYSLRRRVPLDLVASYRRAEITKALGTSDFKEAKRLLPLAWTSLDHEFEEARAKDALGAVKPEEATPVANLSPTLIAIARLDSSREGRDRAAKDGTLPAFMQQQRDTLRLAQAMLDGEIEATASMAELEGIRNGLRASRDRSGQG